LLLTLRQYIQQGKANTQLDPWLEIVSRTNKKKSEVRAMTRQNAATGARSTPISSRLQFRRGHVKVIQIRKGKRRSEIGTQCGFDSLAAAAAKKLS
jgi:hypothetical protein